MAMAFLTNYTQYIALKSYLQHLMFFPGFFSVQVGMVLNTVALYVFCLRTKPKTTSVIYTINLAVTDLLVNLSLPTRILLYYSGGTCLICSYLHIFSYFVNMYCSILFLTCICVDRYISIVQVSYWDWLLLVFDPFLLPTYVKGTELSQDHMNPVCIL